MQTQGNVQLASEDQFDEVRIGLIRSFDKLRGRLTSTAAQQLIGGSGALDSAVESLLSYQPKWEVRNGVIYVTLTSNGRTGPQWIPHLESRGFRLSKYSKYVLSSDDFKPTPAGTVHRVAVLKGEFFSDENRITKEIRAEAVTRKWQTPHPEIAPLFRDTFSDEDIARMGLIWVVVMHEPIEDSDGAADLLRAGRLGDGRWLRATRGNPGDRWSRECGFAFSVPQESSASVRQP